jgi:rhodanese-related sulfurtransferase
VIDPNRAPAVDVQEAATRLARPEPERPLLIDVREASEFAEVRATGARLLPLSGFLAGYQALPKDRPLLLICASGSRSGQATAYLLGKGWTDVVNVAGGTHAWAKAGLPIRCGPLEPGEGDLGL